MAYTYYEIPTVPSPQSFAITLAGVEYLMRLTYHEANAGAQNPPIGVTTDDGSNVDTNDISCWVLDIADSANNDIINGIPLVTGIDLLYQYQYLNFGGSLVVSTDSSPTTVPSFTSLGSTSHLYFVVKS